MSKKKLEFKPFTKEDFRALRDVFERAPIMSNKRSFIHRHGIVHQGEVWGYIAEVEGVENPCWGFIGETLEETGLAESLPPQIGKELIEHAWECRE